MGASLWDEIWLTLLIDVASSIGVAALCFLSVRLWNCFLKQLTPQTGVGESDHDQPLPESDAAAPANGVPDLEMGPAMALLKGKMKTEETNLEKSHGVCEA